MKLVVGLGNPGEKYQGTRHNLGFEVVDKLGNRLQETGVSWGKNDKLKSEICNLVPGAYNFILAKPQTYMNNSGMAVALLVNYFKIKPENIIIIHDDLDLPLGKIKARLGGAAAGHHGVESIIKALTSDQFIRVRLGIGNLESLSGEHKHRSFNAEHFVLEHFLPKENSTVKRMVKLTVKVVETILEKGLEKAQNEFN